jgi:hypothetical protein
MVAAIRKWSGVLVLVLCGLFFCTTGVGRLIGGDVDQDGLDDAWEWAQGYNPAWPTRIIHVDGSAGLDKDDATDDALDKDGDGLANLAEHLGGADLNAADTDGDGTVLYDGYLVVDRVVPDMEVCVCLWGTNNVFEDGTREKWFTAENFNAAGELHFNIIGGTNFTTCQGIGLLQNGMLVRTLQ